MFLVVKFYGCASLWWFWTGILTLPRWRHQMDTFFTLLALCAGFHRSPVNSLHKGQWHGTLMFSTVYPKKYAHGFCFAVLCCGYTLTDCPISIRLTSLALWQSNDCPSASKATLMNMDKYFMWHYERLHNHNKAKHNKTVCIFLGIYCMICAWINTWVNNRGLCLRRHRAHYDVTVILLFQISKGNGEDI